MVSQIQGLRPGASDESVTGMVLEKQSVINLRVPVASRKGYDIASLVTRTRVNDIEIKQLSAQTFMPPKGYNKVEDQPPLEAGEDTQPILMKQPRVQLPLALSVHSKI
jgi:hypothetical protein